MNPLRFIKRSLNSIFYILMFTNIMHKAFEDLWQSKIRNMSLTLRKTCWRPRFFDKLKCTEHRTDYHIDKHGFFEDIYWKSTRWFPKKNSFIATYKAITVVKIQFFCEIVIITICLKVKNWEYMRQIHNVRSVTLYKYVNGFWYTLTAICKSRRIQKKNITTCRIPQAQRGVL